MNSQNRHTFLSGITLIIGICICAISILCNWLLYQSFAHEDSELFRYTYSSLGALFDFAKFSLAIIIGILWYRFHAFISAFICSFFWLCLTAISLFSAFGFLSVVNQEFESNNVKESMLYKSASNSLETTQAKLDSMANYSNVTAQTEIEAKLQAVRTKLSEYFQSDAKNMKGSNAGTILSRVNDCTGSGYYVKIYCPKVQEYKSQIAELSSELSKYTQFETLTNSITQKMESIGNMSLNSISSNQFMHPLFTGMSSVFGESAETMKYRFLICSAFILELLSSWLLVVFSKLGAGQSYDDYEVKKKR